MPPDDPEEWTDEEWLTWLIATDEDAPDDGSTSASLAHRATHFTVGVVLGQAMLGMAKAIYGRGGDEEIVVVVDGDDSPRDDEPFRVHLDPEHPERSSVVFTDRERPSREESPPESDDATP